jgi:acyl-CoA synthetase (AMP-forming)/AMP-acid ligase II
MFQSIARRIADGASSDRICYRFLDRGETEIASLSFAELDVRARSLAAGLLGHVAPGERVLLVFEPGPGFVEALVACLYAGLVAIPAPAPRPGASLDRLEGITRTSKARLILTSAAIRDSLEQSQAEDETLRPVRIVAIEALGGAPAGALPGLDLAADRPVLIQYTSGSTLEPRGVVLDSACISANVEEMMRALRLRSDEEVFVNWMPHFHDMGLIGSFLLPLLSRGEMVHMPPLAFVQKPARWLEAISRYRGTMCGGPPLAFDMCVARIADETVDTLDLSSWRIAFCGAEPVFEASLDRFRRTFARTGLEPRSVFSVYGLAETTVYAAGSAPPDRLVARAEAGVTERAPCFLDPVARSNLRIVDPDDREASEGGEGEIWVTGPSVAGGYLDDPEATRRVFENRIEGDDRLWVRTGDLGVLDADVLRITGRIKDVLIRGGANVAAADVERIAVEGRPRLNPNGAAAFQLDSWGTPIVLLVEKERGPWDEAEEPALVRAIRGSVQQGLGIGLEEVRILEPGALPRTTSGKIQRAEARAGWAARMEAAA